MKRNRRIALGNVRTLGCALVLFGSLVFFVSSALGQSCMPVVYAFRHAEDTNPPNPPGPIFALTPTGQAHAALYPTMVTDFEAANNFCRVTKVYAATKVDKVGDCGTQCASATNAFDTAKPLATAVKLADPITTVGGNQLYEYLGNGNNAPTTPSYTTATATALRKELLATANLGESSAIFWTSQGLHVLGGAIINANSNVPVKNGAPIPPRNAVYLFKATGSAPNITGFSDTPLKTNPPGSSPPSSVYVQCFNHVETSDQFNPKASHFIDPTGDPPTQAYYCGYNNDQSNLGGKPIDSTCLNAQNGTIPNDPTAPPPTCSPTPTATPTPTAPIKSNKDITGKICNTTTSMLPNTSGTSIFGACN